MYHGFDACSLEAISNPVEHAAILHPAGSQGRVAIARRFPGGSKPWQEQTLPIWELEEALSALLGESDVYLSVQRFRGWRRIAQLAELGALAVDVDYYRISELRKLHPLGVLEVALTKLRRAKMPEPSLAIASGRGIYLFWLHRPVPRAALPRWNACQKALWEALRPLGADRNALDAARVLRVIGTRHSEAQVLVEALSPPGEVWEFDRLADEVLPLTRTELHDLRIRRALKRAEKPQKHPTAAPKRFTAETLWEARLSDLQTLRNIRWFGEPLPDLRNRWLFIAGVGMSWIAVPQVLQRELFALAREVGGWTEGKTRSKMQAVFRTAREAAAGKRVRFAGVEWDSRYRLKNQTIIDWLEITGEEERELRTIISSEERRRRERERDEKRRREAGATTRKMYEGRAVQRRSEALKMAADGMRAPAIAEALGVSIHSVKGYLYRDV